MQSFPVYKPNNAESIWARIHCPTDDTVWDVVNEELKEKADTSKANTIMEVTWDDVLLKYVLEIPDNLPTDKEYDLVFYTSEDQTEVHLGRRVLHTKLRGFVQAGQTHIPSWI